MVRIEADYRQHKNNLKNLYKGSEVFLQQEEVHPVSGQVVPFQ